MIKESVRNIASLIYCNPRSGRVKRELGYQDQNYLMPPQTHPLQEKIGARYDENKNVEMIDLHCVDCREENKLKKTADT
jgi:hypothetical protein